VVVWAVAACSLSLFAEGVRAQTVEVSTGLLIAEEPSRVVPMVSVAIGTDVLGLPLIAEAGYGRSDFTSFGEAFHRHFGVFALGTEWFPAQRSVGLRAGLGAELEDDESEDDPGFRSSGNWAGGVVVALVFRRTLGSGRELRLLFGDHILGPVNAIFDPDEYDFGHRVRLLVGIGF
jgi:hypothetical protein